MAYRVTITQTKTEFTPEGVDFFIPSDNFKTFFQSWIDSGHMIEIQNTLNGDGSQKVSIVEFTSEIKHNEFINEVQNNDYVSLRNDYNETNKISFNRTVEVV